MPRWIIIACLITKAVRADEVTIPYQTEQGALAIISSYLSSDESSKFFDHGCWCAKLNPNSLHIGLGGKTTVDDLDHLCKQWAQARSCTRDSDSVCANGPLAAASEYMINYDQAGVAATTCANAGTDDCLDYTCAIDIKFAELVKGYVANNTYTADVSPVCGDLSSNRVGQGRTCPELPTIPLPAAGSADASGATFGNITIGDSAEDDPCHSTVADVVFILDGSGSVSEENFNRSKTFIQEVADTMNISPGGANAALIQFAWMPSIEFGFQKNLADLTAALEPVEQMGGPTFTGRAMQLAIDQVFTDGGRVDATPIMVIITDGMAFDDIITPATNFKGDEGLVFVVGVGQASEWQLNQIVSVNSETGRKYLWFDDWSALETIYKEIAETACVQSE